MASADSKTNSRRCSCIVEPVERKNSERERQRECLLANGRSVGGVQGTNKKIDGAHDVAPPIEGAAGKGEESSKCSPSARVAPQYR